MKYIILALIILSFFFANIFQNRVSGSLEKRIYPANLFQMAWMLLAIVLFAVIGTSVGGLHFTRYTIRMGSLAGIFNVAGGICLLGALASGPLSMTILIFSMYIIVPPVLATLFLGETATICQLIGMILILVVLFLSNYKTNDEKETKSPYWWLLCIGSIAGIGIANYVMKVHQSRLPDMELWEYSISSYAAGAAYAAAMAILFYNKEKKKKGFIPYRFHWKNFYIPAVGMAIAEGAANWGNLYNASRLPAIVLTNF